MKKFDNLFINEDWLVTELAIYSRYKPDDYAPISTLVDVEYGRVKSIMGIAANPFYYDKLDSFIDAFLYVVGHFDEAIPEKIMNHTLECAYKLAEINHSKDINDPGLPVHEETYWLKALKVDQIIWPHY